MIKLDGKVEPTSRWRQYLAFFLHGWRNTSGFNTIKFIGWFLLLLLHRGIQAVGRLVIKVWQVVSVSTSYMFIALLVITLTTAIIFGALLYGGSLKEFFLWAWDEIPAGWKEFGPVPFVWVVTTFAYLILRNSTKVTRYKSGDVYWKDYASWIFIGPVLFSVIYLSAWAFKTLVVLLNMSVWKIALALGALIFVVTIGIILLKYFDWKLTDKLWAVFTHITFSTFVGIVTLNALFWVISPETYDEFWKETPKFFIVNFALWLAICLWMVPADKAKNDGKTHPIASKLATAIFIMVLIIVGWTIYTIQRKHTYATTTVYVLKNPLATTYKVVPDDPEERRRILTKIGWFESRNLHYDGKVVRRNPTSSAVGELQIMESLHRRTAEAMGIDIMTPEGNYAFGDHLLQMEGTRPWEGEPQTLRGLVETVGLFRPRGWVPGRDSLYAALEIPTKEAWSAPVTVPNINGHKLTYDAFRLRDGGKREGCEIRYNGDPRHVYPVQKKEKLDVKWDYDKDGNIRFMQLRCKEPGSVEINLVPIG